MKLTATVMGERPHASGGGVADVLSDNVPHAIADLHIDGGASLIAASLRALADAIEPPRAGIRREENGAAVEGSGCGPT